jgi:hypothetical protein
MAAWSDVPDDALRNVFTYLSGVEVARCDTLSKSVFLLTRGCPFLWSALLAQEFGGDAPTLAAAPPFPLPADGSTRAARLRAVYRRASVVRACPPPAWVHLRERESDRDSMRLGPSVELVGARAQMLARSAGATAGTPPTRYADAAFQAAAGAPPPPLLFAAPPPGLGAREGTPLTTVCGGDALVAVGGWTNFGIENDVWACDLNPLLPGDAAASGAPPSPRPPPGAPPPPPALAAAARALLSARSPTRTGSDTPALRPQWLRAAVDGDAAPADARPLAAGPRVYGHAAVSCVLPRGAVDAAGLPAGAVEALAARGYFSPAEGAPASPEPASPATPRTPCYSPPPPQAPFSLRPPPAARTLRNFFLAAAGAEEGGGAPPAPARALVAAVCAPAHAASVGVPPFEYGCAPLDTAEAVLVVGGMRQGGYSDEIGLLGALFARTSIEWEDVAPAGGRRTFYEYPSGGGGGGGAGAGKGGGGCDGEAPSPPPGPAGLRRALHFSYYPVRHPGAGDADAPEGVTPRGYHAAVLAPSLNALLVCGGISRRSSIWALEAVDLSTWCVAGFGEPPAAPAPRGTPRPSRYIPTTGAPPRGRHGHSATLAGNAALLVYGGGTGGDILRQGVDLSDAHVLDLATLAWTQLRSGAPAPHLHPRGAPLHLAGGRCHAAAPLPGGALLVFGGTQAEPGGDARGAGLFPWQWDSEQRVLSRAAAVLRHTPLPQGVPGAAAAYGAEALLAPRERAPSRRPLALYNHAAARVGWRVLFAGGWRFKGPVGEVSVMDVAPALRHELSWARGTPAVEVPRGVCRVPGCGGAMGALILSRAAGAKRPAAEIEGGDAAAAGDGASTAVCAACGVGGWGKWDAEVREDEEDSDDDDENDDDDEDDEDDEDEPPPPPRRFAFERAFELLGRGVELTGALAELHERFREDALTLDDLLLLSRLLERNGGEGGGGGGGGGAGGPVDDVEEEGGGVEEEGGGADEEGGMVEEEGGGADGEDAAEDARNSE